MINETLKQLGLGEKEIRVYTSLLQYGKITPAALAKIIGLNRSTVYGVAKELVEKGIIAEDLGGPNIYLVARPADELMALTKKEELELENKKQLVKAAVGQLRSMEHKEAYSAPKIIFIEEKELEAHLYRQTVLWAESIRQKEGTWWGFQDHTFVEHYEKWIDWSWESDVQHGISLKLLSNEREKEIKKKTFLPRMIKFWKQSKNFTATTWICGDYVIMLATKKRPHYLVEIHDALFAHNQREVFKGIWNTMELQK